MNKSVLRKGFTLLEMLVVISIISVLVAMVSISYSQAQKKARDTRRKEDLKALQNCLEQAFSVNNSYPNISIVNTASDHYLIGDCNANGLYTDSTDVTIRDPVNSGSYIYSAVQGYTITAPLEATNGTTSYVVRNLQ